MGVLCLPRQVRNELEGFVILEESFDMLGLGWKKEGGVCGRTQMWNTGRA